ncbi:hypothetical protein IAT40_003676 [Kwoniella sp. CBS 6097]
MSVLNEVPTAAPLIIGVAQNPHFNINLNGAPTKLPEPTKVIGEETIEITILSAPCSPASSVDYTHTSDGVITGDTVDDAKAAKEPLARYPELSDEQLWEPWFAFPSKPHMTLHRWAEGQKSRLNMHIHTLPAIPTEADLHAFLSYSRWTLSSLKILVLGSILLIRGVQHGPQMGRTLFGRMLGDRYHDLMAFGGSTNAVERADVSTGIATKRANGKKFVGIDAASLSIQQGQGEAREVKARAGLVDDEFRIKAAVDEARALQIRSNEFFAEGKYEASLEHYGMAIVRLIPWDLASLSPLLAKQTGFIETDQALLLSIALTSLRMVQILPPRYRSQTSIAGSRLYRLTRAACDYVKLSPVPATATASTTPSPPSSPSGAGSAESGADAELDLVDKLEDMARELAGVNANEEMQMGSKGGKSVREVRRSMEQYFGLV